MQRLSGLDAIFLNVETDSVPMHVGALLIVDPAGTPGFGLAAVRETLRQRMHLMPALRRRLLVPPLNLTHPFWIEDPDFCIDRHLQRVELPSPGTHAELEKLVGRLLEPRLDRSRPLWQLYYIDGLLEGRVACLWKVHHACFDGVLGAELFSRVLDTAPEAASPPPPLRPWRPDRIPSPAQMLWWTARSAAAAPRRAIELLRETGAVVGALAAADTPAPAAQPVGPADQMHSSRLPLLAPRTCFNSAITARRSYAFGTLSMKTIKAVKTAFDATVNDVVLALCAQASRDYLLKYAELPEQPMVAAIPISVRHKDDEAATNQVVIGRVSLATNIADPATRLRAMSSRMKRMKRVHKSIPPKLMMDWLDVPLPAVLSRVAKLNESLGIQDRFNIPINLVVSNIPGPQQTLYLAGAKVVALYPASIAYHGLGINITLMSYCDQLHVGLTAHPGTVPNVGYFLRCMRNALSELRGCAEAMTAASTATAAAPLPA